ncbi:MAG: hypothetical protein ACKO40_13690 [Planctomycetaceae bacterium]
MTLRIMLSLLAVACGGFAIAQPPEGRDGPPPGRADTIRQALDTNGDHELYTDEIKSASANLAKADTNGDGKLDHEEFRPPLPPIPRGEGGFRGPPPREGGAEGRPPRGEASEATPPREGRPFRDGALRGDGAARPEGGPSPERFVERALTFDADGDGKLDRAELEKFAGEVMQRMRAGMAERGMGPGGPRDGGFRPADGPRRRPESGEEGSRPERPRRPE